MKQYYEEACSRLDVEDEQEQEETFGSDDEVCIGGGHAAAANVACPLSGKPVSPYTMLLKLTYCTEIYANSWPLWF